MQWPVGEASEQIKGHSTKESECLALCQSDQDLVAGELISPKGEFTIILLNGCGFKLPSDFVSLHPVINTALSPHRQVSLCFGQRLTQKLKTVRKSVSTE